MPTHNAVAGPLPNLKTRVCSGTDGCGQSKPEEEFGWQKGKASPVCRACRQIKNAQYMRTYRNNHPDTVRRANLWRLYRMRPEQYDALRAEQDFRCAACGIHEDGIDVSKVGGRRRADGERAQVFALQVDHCHATDKIRGLLCPECNKLIGLARESIAVLNGCATYLATHQQTEPPRGDEVSATYRITYTIERREDGEADFTEVGFGSTAGDESIDAALYHAQSDIQNRQWETTDGMPEPVDA